MVKTIDSCGTINLFKKSNLIKKYANNTDTQLELLISKVKQIRLLAIID